jgi:hypothetical protein
MYAYGRLFTVCTVQYSTVQYIQYCTYSTVLYSTQVALTPKSVPHVNVVFGAILSDSFSKLKTPKV